MACSFMMMHMLSHAAVDQALSRQSQSSASPAVLVTAALAVTGLAVTGYRYATAHQDRQVIADIDNTLDSLHIPKIDMTAVRQAAQTDKYNEKNVGDFFKKLTGAYKDDLAQDLSSKDIMIFGAMKPLESISKERKAVNTLLTKDLWFRSWFNSDVTTKRKEVQACHPKINDAQAFANEHAEFIEGYKEILDCDQLDIENVRLGSSSDKDKVDLIRNHQSVSDVEGLPVFDYKIKIDVARAGVKEYNDSPYANLQTFVRQRYENMKHLSHAVTDLQVYNKEKDTYYQEQERKNQEELNKIAAEQLKLNKARRADEKREHEIKEYASSSDMPEAEARRYFQRVETISAVFGFIGSCFFSSSK